MSDSHGSMHGIPGCIMMHRRDDISVFAILVEKSTSRSQSELGVQPAMSFQTDDV